jgi:hypothetical protein
MPGAPTEVPVVPGILRGIRGDGSGGAPGRGGSPGWRGDGGETVDTDSWTRWVIAGGSTVRRLSPGRHCAAADVPCGAGGCPGRARACSGRLSPPAARPGCCTGCKRGLPGPPGPAREEPCDDFSCGQGARGLLAHQLQRATASEALPAQAQPLAVGRPPARPWDGSAPRRWCRWSGEV